MEKIDKTIELLQAFKEGKTIERRSTLSEDLWIKVKTYDGLIACLEREANLRIAKEPTYRPYANAKEFLKASKEHGPYLKCLQNVYYIPYNVNITVSIHAAKNVWTYKELLENDFKWSDDSVCGILEQ